MKNNGSVCKFQRFVAAVLLSTVGDAAFAQSTVTWTTGTSSVLANWSSGALPGVNDTVFVGSINPYALNSALNVKGWTWGANANGSFTFVNGGSLTIDGGVGASGSTSNAKYLTFAQPNSAATLINASSFGSRGFGVISSTSTETAFFKIQSGLTYNASHGIANGGQSQVNVATTADRNGTLTVSGSLIFANTVTLGAPTGSGTATLILDGGYISVASAVVAAPGGKASFLFNSGTLGRGLANFQIFSNNASPLDVALGSAGSRVVDTNNGLITVLPSARFVDLTLQGSLTKSGSGTLVLQGANTYTGDTVITTGTLRVENVAQQILSGTVGGTGNKTISSLASTVGLFIGQPVTGTGITANAYITALTATSITLSGSGTPGAVAATFAGADGTLQGTTLNYDNQGGVFSFGQSAALVLGGLKGLQNLALTNAAAAPVMLSVGGNNANTDYGGAFSGAGSLVKQGTGVFTLSGSSTFTGATAVNAGKLVVNGALANTSGMTVASGATVGGSGSINGLTTVDGTLAPGNSPGLLTFDSLLLSSSATTLIEIAAAGVRGTDYDGINVLDTNGLTYGGTLTFAFGGSALADNSLFSIFNLAGGTAAGSFTTLTSTGFYDGSWSSVGGGQWQSSKGSQTLTFSESTGQLVIVPEPGTLICAALGSAMAGWSLWRRQRVAKVTRR